MRRVARIEMDEGLVCTDIHTVQIMGGSVRARMNERRVVERETNRIPEEGQDKVMTTFSFGSRSGFE